MTEIICFGGRFMFELHQLTESAFYIESPAKIGLIRLNKQTSASLTAGTTRMRVAKCARFWTPTVGN